MHHFLHSNHASDRIAREHFLTGGVFCQIHLPKVFSIRLYVLKLLHLFNDKNVFCSPLNPGSNTKYKIAKVHISYRGVLFDPRFLLRLLLFFLLLLAFALIVEGLSLLWRSLRPGSRRFLGRFLSLFLAFGLIHYKFLKYYNL